PLADRTLYCRHCYRHHLVILSFPTRRSSDLALVVTAVSNIAINYYILYVLNLGVAAVAMGTIIAAIIGVLVMVTHFFKKTNQLRDRKSTRLNSSHVSISYAVFCLKKKKFRYTVIIGTGVTISKSVTIIVKC